MRARSSPGAARRRHADLMSNLKIPTTQPGGLLIPPERVAVVAATSAQVRRTRAIRRRLRPPGAGIAATVDTVQSMSQSPQVATRRSRAFACYVAAVVVAVVSAVVAAALIGGLSGELPVYDPTPSEVSRWNLGQGAMWTCLAALVLVVLFAWMSSRFGEAARSRKTLVLAGVGCVAAAVAGVATWFIVLPPT